MPNRIANVALTVHREGKRINVKAGEKFNFTKEEIADFTKLNAAALRLPINEGSAEDEAPANTALTHGGKSGDAQDNPDVVDLDSMKVDELRKFAKENDLDVDTTQTKEPLLAAIKASLAGEL